MKWFLSIMGSSIGKKLMMACTGLCFIGFLGAHLAGNLTLYGGGDLFNSYAAHLHSLGFLIRVAEIALLSLFAVHVITGLVLFFQNIGSRPVRYAVKRSEGGRTIGSRTMPYTGLAILLFIVVHLLNFHFVDKTDRTIFEIVRQAFADPVYILMYIAAMIVVAVHVSHGLWSAFQTLGVSHPKYSPLIRMIGITVSLAFGFGFGLLPIYVSLML